MSLVQDALNAFAATVTVEIDGIAADIQALIAQYAALDGELAQQITAALQPIADRLTAINVAQ